MAKAAMGEVAILEDFLRARGQKMTRPRQAVLESFLAIERHVTAEQLYEAVRASDPGIGQATVFRAMRLFVEAGLAREALRDGGPCRYEHAFRHEHHDHLVCAGCGKTVEFADPGIERAQARIYAAHGYKPLRHSLQLFGLCGECSKKR
jgi:Fur family ferric uptake transcriptional regulator